MKNIEPASPETRSFAASFCPPGGRQRPFLRGASPLNLILTYGEFLSYLFPAISRVSGSQKTRHLCRSFSTPEGAQGKFIFTRLRPVSIIIITLAFIILTSTSCCKNNKVQNLGIFAPNRINHVVGQDGCTPIPINNNMMLWTFGDTILGTWKKKVHMGSTFEDSAVMKNMISNSLAYSSVPDDDNIQDLEFYFYKEKNQVSTFIKKTPDENNNKIRLWAIDGIKIKNSVFVYYMIIKINKNQSEIFSMNGIGIAKCDIPVEWKGQPDIKFKRLGRLFEKNSPTFGDCVIERKKFLYLIGHKKNKDDKGVSAYIARVGKNNITKRWKYKFLLRNGLWTENIKLASGFFKEVMGELSLSYNNYLKKYVIIYCALSGEIKVVLFNSFDKIMEAKTVILYTPQKLKKIKNRPFLFYYSGKEIFSTEEAIYAIYIHPAIYQPILLKVPYGFLQRKNKKIYSYSKKT